MESPVAILNSVAVTIEQFLPPRVKEKFLLIFLAKRLICE